MISLRNQVLPFLDIHSYKISYLISLSQYSTYINGYNNYLDGTRTDVHNKKHFVPIIQPSNGKLLFDMPISASEDVSKAVGSSFKAFRIWSKLSGFERGKLLKATADKIRENLNTIAELEVTDTGKPIWEAKLDISYCSDTFEYYAGVAATIHGSHHKLSNGNFAEVHRDPLGVVCGIGAWNYPFQVMTWKTAVALACGNTIVFKPSPLTPLSAVYLADLMTKAGVPKGVVNILQGDGETGELLCSHPDVAKVTFTGSVSTGKKILSLCAKGMKRVTLELGGKSPLIVFPDCDIEQAVKATMIGNFLTQGEVCTNCTRVFVERNIASEFISRLVSATKKMTVGDPMNYETTVGATINQQHALKVLGYVEQAKREGAVVATGGERVYPASDLCSGGFYLSPCILTNCTDEMTVVKEEVFGAVLSILIFDTEEEVVLRANNSPFGLAAGLMTRDLRRAHRVASQLNAGIIWINNYNIFPPEVPFGGYKMSGIGRENGLAAINDFTQTKTVYFEMGEDIDAGMVYQK